MHSHNVLTDWWQKEIFRIVDEAAFDDPLISSHSETMGMIMHEFAQRIPDDKLMAKIDDSKVPALLHASGCKPTMDLSQSYILLSFNAAPRRACDNIIGALLWLLFPLAVIGVLVALRANFGRQ